MFSIDSWIWFIITELYALALMAFIFRRQVLENKRNVWLKILLAMLAMYLAHLFYTLLSPTYFFLRFRFSLERVNWVPFRVFGEWLAHPLNLFGNVLLFMPLGFFEVLLHPAEIRKKQLWMTAAVSAGLSLFIEFAQCFTYRVPDVDDIILNTIGGVLGALLCMAQQKIGFDRTRVGRVLLPRIPRTWRRHMMLNRYVIILIVSMEAVMFAANYIVTLPKTQVRENTIVQTQAAAAVTAAPGTETVAEPGETTTSASLPETAGEPFETATAALLPETASEPTLQPETDVTEEIVITPMPEPSQAPKVYNTAQLALEAEHVLLVRLSGEDGQDQPIFAYGSTDPIYPASTLKMLTALTVLDIANPEEKVTVGMEIYIPPLDASRASLEYGMTLSIRELLEGLLLPSGADAAYALAVYCGRELEGNSGLSFNDAVNTFVSAMNRKAKEIGAEETTAINVVGLDAKGQLTTCEDILKIAKVFLAHPVLAEICHLPTDRITSEEGISIHLSNTNKMLHEESEYYNKEVAGVKTGTTNKAGNCLVSVFSIQNERYLCIVMNSSYYGKFTDTQTLYEMCAGAS